MEGCFGFKDGPIDQMLYEPTIDHIGDHQNWCKIFISLQWDEEIDQILKWIVKRRKRKFREKETPVMVDLHCTQLQGWLKCGVGSERNLWHFSAHSAYFNVWRKKKFCILTFCDKKYCILMFRDKKYCILTFRDKTESYLTVLQQNNAELRHAKDVRPASLL